MSSSSASRAAALTDGAERSQSIVVVCRVRPMSEKELKEKSEAGVKVNPNGVGIDISSNGDVVHFDYDAVLGPTGTQQEVYEQAAQPVVDDFLSGFNGTVFAYGQTGSGKTHTMEGQPHDQGLLPRIVKQLFDFFKSSAAKRVESLLHVQFLEIYNEKIRDLLAPEREDLKIRENHHQGIHVEGASSYCVTTEREVLALIEAGAAARSVAETKMNQHSSRSHSILVCTLEQTNTADLTTKRSKLFMVDLAGSEMVKHTGSEGVTLKEAQHINTSLSALSSVINTLAERNATHIPYRNSKLTRLLQEAIGGNCRTALIICCSPAKSSSSETLSTMRFGRAARRIKNKARVNKEKSDKDLAVLLEEVRRRNIELAERLEAKESEVQTLTAACEASQNSLDEIGPAAAQRIVAAEEAAVKAKHRADKSEEDQAALAQLLEDTVTQYEERMDGMQQEIERLQNQVKILSRGLQDAAGLCDMKVRLPSDDEEL